MTSKFEEGLDAAYDALEAALGRVPHSDEVEGLEDRQFQRWLTEGRFDDLIEYVHDAYELEGGKVECAQLSEALRKHSDVVRIERLFEHLIDVRSKAYWRSWTEAQKGHVGAMRESARHMAATMEAYADLYHGYWSLQLQEGKAKVREAMLELQDRRKPNRRSAPGQVKR